MMKEVLRWGTLKNYFTTERYLREFLKTQSSSGDIYLRQLTYAFLTDFEFFVRSTPLKNYGPCTNNGTMKHIERVKKIIAWAAKNEWIEKDPFASYQLKFHHKVREYLNELELQDLENRRFDDPILQKVKGLFVFSCYTGLAYADVMALQPGNIVLGMDGFSWIQTCRAIRDKKNKRSVWTILLRHLKQAHFASFPIELPELCIRASSREGDIILDPFMGSGTTALAAACLNRRYIGFELNPSHISITRQRMAEMPGTFVNQSLSV